MKVRYRVVPKQNKKSSFYVNCHSQHVTIQAADSAFSTLLSLRERLSAWYKEKNISFDDIPTNTDTACCFAWKIDTETGEGLDTYYYGGGCGAGEWIEAAEAQREAEEAKNQVPKGKSFAGYDQQDKYDDIDEDDFAPFVEAVELGYFNNSPVVVPRSNHTAAESSSSDTIASVSSTSKASKGFGPKKTTKSTAKRSEGDGKYTRRAPKEAPTDEGMILGPKIEGITSKIMGTLDTPSVIFEGVFVGLDKRDTKTGKCIVNGSIVDDTNSIKFIKFTNSPEEGDELLKQLKGLQRVRVQGSVSFDDRFDKDYILSIRSIEAIETTSVERTENRPDSRVELHLHTKMSDKDALVSVKDLFKTIKNGVILRWLLLIMVLYKPSQKHKPLVKS